jgi:fatty acid-binding protein DegV
VAVVIQDGQIAWLGPTEDADPASAEVLDGGGGCGGQRVRSREAAILRLTQTALSAGKVEQLGVVHGDTPEAGDALRSQLQAHFPGMPITACQIGSVVGTHIGPGPVGVGVLTG